MKQAAGCYSGAGLRHPPSTVTSASASTGNGSNAPNAAGKTFVLQIYVPAVDFEAMTRTWTIGGFGVTRRGAGWFLTNPNLGRNDVQILTT